MNRDVLVTATQAERLMQGRASRYLICTWRAQGKLQVSGHTGRSPLYRWGDVVDVERATRLADRARQRA